jgi:ethanolamine utilization protein EutQ
MLARDWEGSMKKRFLTADMIRAQKAAGNTTLTLEPGDVLTPLARDTAREIGLTLRTNGAPPSPSAVNQPTSVIHPPLQPVEPPKPAAEPAPAAESLPAGVNGGGTAGLEPLIRQIVAACLSRMLTNGGEPTPETPVKRVQSQNVKMQPFPFAIDRPEMDVQLVDVITAQDGSPMSAGFLSFHKGSFPWTLTYDEVEFVLEGEIHIGTAQGTVVGRPGDVLYIPKGTQITFGTPGWAKILYVTYPAEWAG